MQYRMLVLDLDGTALNHHGELEERDIAAVRALQGIGVHVTIATGRLFTGTQWVAERLGVQGAVAVMNGSELIDARTGEVVHGNYLQPATRAHAQEVWSGLGLASAFLFGSRRIHIGRHDAHIAEYLQTWTRELTVHDDLFGSHEWSAADDIVAIGTLGEAESIQKARQALHREVPDEVGSVTFLTRSGTTFLKVRHAAENKGTALRRLAEQQGIEAEACVAVGDWMNDLPMLETAGLSFAMGGTVEPVIASANEELTCQCGEGGAVAEVARRVWGVQL